MSTGPARGLPPRIYVPIVLAVMLAFLGVIGYFLKIGLGVTGAALGPSVAAGSADAPAGPAGVGGGTPEQAAAAGPPPPVARLLVELRDRVQRNPHDRAALLALGNMYGEAGKFAQAEPYYARAVALDGHDPNARLGYAAALHGAGNDAASLAQLDAVLAEKPADPDALFEEGMVAGAAGKRERATAALRSFLRVAPADQRAGDARAALRDLGSSA